MSDLIPLPHTVENLVQQAKGPVHPGLLLDKFVRCVNEDFSVPGETPRGKKWSEAVQSPTIRHVVEETGRLSLPGAVTKHRRRLLEAVGAVCFTARNTTPLTLHLARASALENAGICLHRIYGFAYLPGSGLKGMARAYAETVWLPAQYKHDNDKPLDAAERKKAVEAWAKIEAVFGWSPNSDQKKPWKPSEVKHSEEEKARKKKTPASAGAVVFHDAWCKDGPPRLIKDIVNNHHPKYYPEGKEPPGDWENPVPVYFLAVAPDQEFEFALSLRQGNNKDPKAKELLELAARWLIGALTHAGAGAKTNTGYGQFRLQERPREISADDAAWKTAEALGLRKTATFTVELVTPAFLAGAEQGKDDCDLRGATLRGLLRWWWRTMHAGFLTPRELYELESAIWGKTEQGGAVRVVVERVENSKPVLYDFKDRNRPRRDFAQRHCLGEPPARTTQGLFYLSYGMDDAGRRRWFMEPGTNWKIRLICRSGEFRRQSLTAEKVLQQAELALELSCAFGGVGSKSRKGFGSLRCQRFEEDMGQVLQRTIQAAAVFRQNLRLSNTFSPQRATSPALGTGKGWLLFFEQAVPSRDVWHVLDHTGFSYQAVAQQYKHRREKLALGLPRQIHGPRRDPMHRQRNHRPPERLRGPRGDRHASPVCIHLVPTQEGYLVRVIAFPAAFLPNLEQNRRFLQDFMRQFQQNLQGPFRPLYQGHGGRGPSGGRSGGRRPPRPGGSSRFLGSRNRGRKTEAKDAPGLRSGKRVQAQLLEEKTKKGGWRARELQTGFTGPIVNSKDCPADWQPEETVELVIASVNEQRKEVSFRYQP